LGTIKKNSKEQEIGLVVRMKRILIVMDSCRYDSAVGLDTPFGEPDPAHTDTNHTITAFIDFFCVNKLPRPIDDYINPTFLREFNYIENLKTPVYFISDNPHLHPVNTHVKGMLNLFNEYKVTNKYFHGCKEIIDMANELDLGDDYYLVLWFGETHQPYHYGDHVNLKWKSFANRVVKYNRGADNITDKEMDEMHNKQREACKFILNNVWKFVEEHSDAEVIITADHGESLGENHRYGHGCDVHPAQFTVPIWHRKVNK